MTRRVAVTGIGAVSPAGHTAEETWRSMLEGRSGVGPITLFDPEPYPIRIQAEVKDFELDPRVDAKRQRYMARGVQFGLNAVLEALDDSGFQITDDNRDMVGVIFGTGGGGLEMITEYHEVLKAKGPRRITPFLVANFIDDAASGHIAIQTGARGPNFALVSACATGAGAIGEAFETIRRGDADAVITGSCDAALVPLVHATWCSMRALAKEKARPFDAERDGFVSGEGAGAFILEDYDTARERGARIYCEVIGYGSSNDAYDMIAPDELGGGLRRCMTHAMRKAGLEPTDIDYINPHGSGTPINDRIETRILKEVLGDAAHDIPVSSVKPIVGHCMGAAGSIEAVACILAIRDQVVPPTINYSTPDPECDLDYVPNEPRNHDVRVALSTSVGLGGHNATVIFRTPA